MDPEIPQFSVKQENDCANLHPIFTRDPADWVKLVDHHIQARTEDGQVHSGYVYTVDPVSESIVLINFADGHLDTCNMSLKVLVGASVRNVNIISEGTQIIKESFERLFRPAEEALNFEELNMRKLRLKSWLEKHRLPVTLGGNNEQYLTVADVITVRPPYTEDSCLSTNEIILSRIQGLIRNMPANES